MSVVARIFSTALIVGCLFIAAPATAAAPSNDTPAGARVISSLPTTIVQNIRHAKAEPLDTQLVATGCGLPNPVAASVWFKYTDVSGQGIGYIPKGDFSFDVVVTKGNPAQGNIVSCGVSTDVRGEPGTTYYFGIIANFRPAAGTGNLSFEFFGLPQAKIVVDKALVVDGTVQVSGRYRCTAGAVSSVITVEVTQRRTHGFLFSDFAGPEPCTGGYQEWAGVVGPDEFSGLVFKPGEARVIATVDATDASHEDFAYSTVGRSDRTVCLRKPYKAASTTQQS